VRVTRRNCCEWAIGGAFFVVIAQEETLRTIVKVGEGTRERASRWTKQRRTEREKESKRGQVIGWSARHGRRHRSVGPDRDPRQCYEG
jgi:hypothetical protein